MSDKTVAPNCPRCGQLMDKVDALVMEQLAGGTVAPGNSLDDTVVGWVCPNEKCQQIKG